MKETDPSYNTRFVGVTAWLCAVAIALIGLAALGVYQGAKTDRLRVEHGYYQRAVTLAGAAEPITLWVKADSLAARDSTR